MGKFVLRRATEKDIPFIMAYIDAHWKKDHILAKDRVLFEWQYLTNSTVNMIIGVNEHNEIEGILGYIPYSSDSGDYSLALWKANKDTGFLGIKLLFYFMENLKGRCVFCNGINLNTTKAIYERMGFHIGRLVQWYRLDRRENYNVAKIADKNIPEVAQISDINLKRMDSFENFLASSSKKMFSKDFLPYKSRSYIKHRYFDHVSYDYLVYNICDGNKQCDTAVVFRIQKYNNYNVLRLIDVLGDYAKLALLTPQIDMLLKKYDAEYVDLYEYGLADDVLRQAGWTKVGDNDNIIPNYFSPYLLSNIDIHICTTDKNIVLFKGDGDQDRPN